MNITSRNYQNNCPSTYSPNFSAKAKVNLGKDYIEGIRTRYFEGTSQYSQPKLRTGVVQQFVPELYAAYVSKVRDMVRLFKKKVTNIGKEADIAELKGTKDGAIEVFYNGENKGVYILPYDKEESFLYITAKDKLEDLSEVHGGVPNLYPVSMYKTYFATILGKPDTFKKIRYASGQVEGLHSSNIIAKKSKTVTFDELLTDLEKTNM